MPEKKRPSTAPKLSTVVQRSIVIIPAVAQWMIRAIGGAIAASALIVQAKTHIFGSHKEEAHEFLELAFELAPFAFGITLAVVLIAIPQAFAVAVLEIISRVGRKIGDMIPSRKS